MGITPVPERVVMPSRLAVISEEEEEKRQGSQMGAYREMSPAGRMKGLSLAKVKDQRRKSNAVPVLKPIGAPGLIKPKSSASDINGPGNNGILSALAKSLGSKIKAMQQEPKSGGSRLGQHPKS